MSKKKSQPEKSILTVPLEGELLADLETIKRISGEKTGTAAIRYAISVLPGILEQIENMQFQNDKVQKELEAKQEAVDSILKSVKELMSKNNVA